MIKFKSRWKSIFDETKKAKINGKWLGEYNGIYDGEVKKSFFGKVEPHGYGRWTGKHKK